MMKNVENVREWYPFMQCAALYYEFKMLFFCFLTFQRTELSIQDFK